MLVDVGAVVTRLDVFISRALEEDPRRVVGTRTDGAWLMIAACWYGAPAPERQCKVSVTSGSNLPHGLTYEPIMLTADEWARGGSGGTMSLRRGG
jgi:hypothetical protein